MVESLVSHPTGQRFEFGRNPISSIAVAQGLSKSLLPGVDPKNDAACQIAMGKRLFRNIGETFTAPTATERITYRLNRKQARYEGLDPHFRYAFEEIKREPVTEDALGGFVLEEPSTKGKPNANRKDSDYAKYEPEVLQ